MPACMQNPTRAQNHYDSSENRLKKGVLRPIFPAGLEIRPHPPIGGPPSQILSHAREGDLHGDDLCVTPLGLQILYASPRAARPLAVPLTLGFYVACPSGRQYGIRQQDSVLQALIIRFHTKTKTSVYSVCSRWLKIGCEREVRPKRTPSINQ